MQQNFHAECNKMLQKVSGGCRVYDTTLVFADGTCYKGIGFGRKAPTLEQLLAGGFAQMPLGEIVFNTTMGAYHEIITDPSYAGQSIVMTASQVGNYGVDPDWNEMLGEHPFCTALILRDLYEGPVPNGRRTLGDACVEWNICGLTDVDTRAITLHIRSFGSQYAVAVGEVSLSEPDIARVIAWIARCPTMLERDFISGCSVVEPVVFSPAVEQKARFLLWDFGTKHSIVKELLARGIEVTVVPANRQIRDFLTGTGSYDALFLSNGPGDPASLDTIVHQLQGVLDFLPILGICLGHQLAARALGGTTEKMLYGHHGPNHPVRDLHTQNVYVTAQNHGYCVDAATLPASSTLWLVNDNDQSVEGFYDAERKVMTVQFHPEAAPGPWEARKLFDVFIDFALEQSLPAAAMEASDASKK